MINLYPHQTDALKKLQSGSILNGGVGSGKTLTSLVFFKERFPNKKLHIITTAMKRDTGDWEEEASLVGLEIEVVDSWNNIVNYLNVTNEFFIFDEQRAVGYATWGRAFIKIARKNNWIMLTATPGDTWMDYMPVFIANNFYRNKTDFVEQHVEYDPWVRYPKIKKYHKEGVLMRNRRNILVPMNFERKTKRHRQLIYSNFDKELHFGILKNRWNPYLDQPIENASELLQCMRRSVSETPDRELNCKILLDIHDKVIIFYNYNYERDLIIKVCEELGKTYSEWNGHRHEEIPETDEWVYIVQYTAGAEGWNCIDTNVVIFYSLNYSFKIMEQAEGRIDRLNTPYTDLEYYTLTTRSQIEKDIHNTILNKKSFNESAWAKGVGYEKGK